MQAPQKSRVHAVIWLLFGLSLIWAGLIFAYGVGYVRTGQPEGFGLFLTILSLGFLALVPIAGVLGVRAMTKVILDQKSTEASLRAQLFKLEEELARAQNTTKSSAPVSIETTRQEPPTVHYPSDHSADQHEQEIEAPVDTDQQMLPFADDEPEPLKLEDAIRALDFPKNAQDHAGFAVLRKALQSYEMARLLQASEDCLNFLSQHGLYMDDLLLAPATGEDWRKFASGGTTRAALLPITGIVDPGAVQLVKNQLRADAIFRDAALHFQRKFDQILQQMAPSATDTDLLNLIDTRTGRAFVLVAQASGTLD